MKMEFLFLGKKNLVAQPFCITFIGSITTGVLFLSC